MTQIHSKFNIHHSILFMRILQLCRKFPYPLKDGEAIAVTNLAKAYQGLGHEVILLSFNTIKTYYDTQQLPASFNHYTAIHTVYLDNRVTIKGAFLNLFTSDSYHITRFISSTFKDKLKEILSNHKFDLVQLEGINVAPYIPIIREHSQAKIVMRAHNVEFEIWERVANTTSFLPKKWYLQHLVKQLKQYEIDQLSAYDLLLAMTQRDLNIFKQLAPINEALVTPIGLDLKDYQNTPPLTVPPYSISFIGSLDWMPNQDGLKWFLEKVWPAIHQKYPTLTFHIAGRNPPPWVFGKAGNGVIVHGEVADAKTFVLSHPITVVPLLSGSGMRVKILESMALGRAVLTTSIGLEGIEANHQQEVLIGDTPTEFIALLDYCLSFPEQVQRIAKNARDFAFKKYDNMAIGKKVLQVMESDEVIS